MFIYLYIILHDCETPKFDIFFETYFIAFD